MTLGEPSINHRNDLDECLTYLELPFESARFKNIPFWAA